MATNPRVSVDIEIANAERAMARVQNLIARKPIKIQLASDAKALDGLDKGLGRLSGRADEFSKSLEAANARVLAFGASVSVITAIEVAFKKLITTTISVEAAFKKIEVVGDQFASTAGQLEKFGRGIFDVARQTGQSFDVTATAALEFARQGLSAAETLKRVKDALTLTRLSGLDATSSVEGLTAAVNAFRKEGLTTTDVINKLIAVDNKYAVSSADLIEAIKRSGSFAQDAGTSFDELAATVTVLQEVTARGGSVIGNSLKTIFERVRRPESIIQLQNLGVEVRGVKGEMLPAIKIIDNFSKKLSSLSDTERQGALRQLAGTFQINQLSALVGVLGEAEGAAKRYDAVLATSANASIEASVANQKLNESLDSQVKSVLASATEFGAAFGNLSIAPLLKDVLKDSGNIFGVLTDSLQSEGPSIGKAFAKVFGDALAVGLGAGTLVVSRFIIQFVKFAKESFSTVLRINDASKNQEGLQLSILNLLRSRSDVEQAILSAGNSEVAQAKVLRDLYNEMAATEARRLSISNAVAKNLNAGGYVVNSTGLPAPRGKGGRAADGYVPNLVQAEYKDVMKGVGGANKNSKIISLENFPFSGGKKGTMVVNSSEGIMPLGNGGAAVLTKDMMGRRAAGGNVPSLSLESAAVAAKSGKFISVGKIEKSVDELVRSLNDQGKTGLQFSNAIRSALKDFNLTGESIKDIARVALSFSKELKIYEQAIKEAYNQAIVDNANKRKQASESKRLLDVERANSTIQNAPNKRASFSPSIIGGGKSKLFFPEESSQKIFNFVDGYFEEFQKEADKSISLVTRNVRSTTRFRSVGNLPEPNLSRQLEPVKPISRKDILDQAAKLLGNVNVSNLPTPDLFPSSLGGTDVFEQRKIKQNALKARLLSGQGLSGPGRGLSEIDARASAQEAADQRRLAQNLESLNSSTKSVSKTFSQASIEFGTSFASIFLGASVVKEAFSLVGVQADKMVDGLSSLLISLVAFKKLGEIGGIGGLNSPKLFGNFKKGVGLGGRSGPLEDNEINLLQTSKAARLGSKASGLLAPVLSFGSGLLRFLPVLGQLSVAAFAASTILKTFGVDVGGIIYKAFGGISEEAKKLKEGFKELSEAAYQNGKFIGISSDEINRKTKELDTFAQIQAEAERRGIKTEGKSREQVISETFENRMEKVLKSVETGRTKTAFGGGFAQQGPSLTTAKETFFDLPKEVRSRIEPILQGVLIAPLEDLRKTAGQQLGLNGADLQKLGLEEVQTKLFEAILKELANSVKDIPISSTEKVFENQSSTRFLAQLRGRFTQGGKAALQTPTQEDASFASRFTSAETAKQQIASAIELRRLQIGFSTEKERELDLKIKSTRASELEMATLENQRAELTLQRDIRQQIFDLATKSIDELSGDESFKSQTIEIEKLKAAVEQISKLGKDKSPVQVIQQVANVFSKLDSSTQSSQILSNFRTQVNLLEKITKEREKQLFITQQQAKLEAQVSQQVRLRTALPSLAADILSAGNESKRADINSRSSVIDALSGSPNATISQQNSLRKESINLKIQELSIDKEQAAIDKKRKEDLFKKGDEFKKLTPIEQEGQLKLFQKEYDNSIKSINAQTEALKIQAQQVGEVASYYTSLANSIEQFYAGLGELEGSNTFDILRSGDLSSLLSGLSGKQALSDFKGSGKGGAEGIEFYNERLNIRQKETEIIAVQTEAQKLQLEQEKKLLEDIFRIKKEGGTAEEQITKLIEAQNSRLKEQRSIRSGIRSAQAQLKDETNEFGATFGETATLGFRDAISEALKAAANNTGDLKTALLDVALSFANKLRDAALDNLANIITNGVTGGGSGGGGGIVSGLLGLFSKKATGGKVTGGSGNKDDVPTLLMGGEYVVNKKSVQKYGPQFFEALNQGRIGGMASGGMFDPSYSGKAIRGSGNLKKFASQNATSGANDRIMSLGGGAGSVELEPESLRLTNFGRENSPLFQATQSAKEQALGLVFEDQRLQQQYKDALKSKEKAEKEKLNQLYLSLAIAAVGAGMSSLGGSGGVPGGEGSLYGNYKLPTYDKGLNFLGSTADNARIISQGATRSVIKSASSAANVSSGTIRAASNLNLPIGGFDINRYSNPLFNYRAAGGAVNGNGHGDNVPAMLTGGEFVLNRRASKKLGFSNLSAANTGQSLGTSEETSKELNDRVVTKLDELIQTISSTGGGVNVNVQMDGQGKTQSNESGDQSETQRNLNRRIKDAVVAVLREEKRLGGVLS